ncbi:MAG: DUF5615 family PIN-like protein [Anaerolineae bacterium]
MAGECCDAVTVEALRDDGHDVLYVIESLRGATDDVVLEQAFAENRILLTEDKDFVELVYQLRYPAYGIILLRFETQDAGQKIPRLRTLLIDESDRIAGAFVVLDPRRTRIRPLR